MEGLKVVSAEEMARIEKWAIERGSNPEHFMQEAGRKVAQAAMEYSERHRLPKKIALLVGKGNNGGDAYAAGVALLDEGWKVRALPLYSIEECSPLNRKFNEKFVKKRGKMEPVQSADEMQFAEDGLILDGYLGTGFKGKVALPMALAIHKANQSHKPILAIDIPSGLNGTTGEVGNCAILAKETIALGLPKMGFFLRQGWNCVGHLRVEDFGLSQAAIDEASAMATFPDWNQIQLPPMVRTRHKYQAGYVVGFGGCKEFPSAPKMAGLAALRSGAGIVRLFHREEIGSCPLELISNPWKNKEWKKELKRAHALFLGPGLGKSKKIEQWLQKNLKGIQLPCVIDADALLSTIKTFPEMAILTPHHGEAIRLLGLKNSLIGEEELFAQMIRFSEKKQVVVLLKGAPTFVFSPGKIPVIVTRGDPGMASAGTGDVLTGILAALLAQGMFCQEAAILGAALHGIAGEEAAKARTSYSMIATDLIEFLPKAFQAVMKWNEGAVV